MPSRAAERRPQSAACMRRRAGRARQHGAKRSGCPTSTYRIQGLSLYGCRSRITYRPCRHLTQRRAWRRPMRACTGSTVGGRVQVRTSPSMPSLRSLSAPYASTTWGRSAPGVRSLLEATSQLFACLKKQNRSHAAAWCYGLPQYTEGSRRAHASTTRASLHTHAQGQQRRGLRG